MQYDKMTDEQKRARLQYNREYDKRTGRAAHKKYDQKYIKTVVAALHSVHDADIIERLQKVENKSAYLKSLIRADMQNSTK